MSVVTLSWMEVRVAAVAGVDRRIRALAHGLADFHPGAASKSERGWELDIQGALAEMAAAKVLDLYWAGGWPKDGDVARHQIRSTVLQDGRLVVNTDDPDDCPFILVVGAPPRLRIPGWMSGREAKQARWWQAGVQWPAFFVPQAALHPMEELREVQPWAP